MFLLPGSPSLVVTILSALGIKVRRRHGKYESFSLKWRQFSKKISVSLLLLLPQPRFVVLPYASTISILTINEARMDMFCRKKQNIECLPPTENALFSHTNCIVFRASIWMTADSSNPDIATPKIIGWKWLHSQWQPVWLTVPETTETCRILFIRCNGDCVRCKCADANCYET